MLSRVSALFVYLVTGLAVSAVATPMGKSSGYGDGKKRPSMDNYDKNECNVGKTHCCEQLNDINEHETSKLVSILSFGGVLSGTGLFGSNCSPFLGKGATCQTNPVCCEDTKFEGFFAFGCQNINVNVIG